MSEKNFIKLVLASILIVISVVYVLERNVDVNHKTTIDMYYAHADNKEVLDYKENKVDNFMWYDLEPNVGKIDTFGEKFVIIKFKIDDIYTENKKFYARMRNKIAEVYIDGVLIERNGEVGKKGQIYNNMTTYYDVSIPITSSYAEKEIIIIIESPTKFEARSVESIEVISETDVFRNKGVFEITMVFFTFIALAITVIAALYLFWMRLNFTNKLYRILVPTWCILGFIVLSLPYYNINYPRYEETISFWAYILGVGGLFFILYGLRKTMLNTYVTVVINFLIIVLWMGVAAALVAIRIEVINWSFVHYTLEMIMVILAIPIFIIGYINAKNDEEMFVVPLKLFWSYCMIASISIFSVYYFTDFLSIGRAMNFTVFALLVGIIVFVSYIMNIFHSSLFVEIKSVVSESEVYDSIDISRDNIFYDKKHQYKETRKHEYNNLSVKYAKALINADIYACSVILKPKADLSEIEVVYCKTTFDETEITQQEARYYLLLFEKIFNNKDFSTVRRGKNVYLGFKQDNLYYLMIISPKEEIGELKFKALVSYTNSIKNTAYNYVITNYIEKAQSDVIRSFGETIEARISSNNVIGITDRFVEFIARCMGKSEGEVQTLKTASYIKNIGTIIMSDNYVRDFHLKSDAEVIEAYKRATYGYDILNKFDDSILSTASIMSKYQFENYDGSGYLGKKSEQIPDESKIIKIAVAMTSALRYEINIDKLYDEVMRHIESEKFAGQLSPYILAKVKAKNHLFKESFDLTDEDLVTLIHSQIQKNVDDFIM